MHEDTGVIRWVVWIGGVCAFIFGLCDRTFAATIDHVISALDIVLLGTASVVAFGWIYLIPASSARIIGVYEKLAYKLGIFL
jgi:hypothetical protein